MVVTNLESYVKNIPGAVYSANLRELIKEDLSSNHRPTIVLDASSFFYCFKIKEQMQPSFIRKSIEDFVENITSCGANLITVLRGNIQSNSDSWYKEYQDKLKNMEKACEIYKKKGTMNDALNEFEAKLLHFCHFISFASISSNHYKVFTSVKNVHEEVSEISTTQNCLAVIGQDSNYYIYEGIRHNVFVHGLNLVTLECKMLDKSKLLEHLGLKSYHLPLFATLSGNNVVNPSYLHHFLGGKKFLYDKKFLRIAKMIKDTTSDPYKHAKDMVKLINHPEVDENLIIKSLDMYLKFSENSTENELEMFANERKKLGEWSKNLHRIFIQRKYLKTFTFNYAPVISELSTLSVVRPLNKKIYGILFYGDESPAVDEYYLEEMRIQKTENPTPCSVMGEKPKCEHPGLIQLWDKSTPNLSFLKWNLFCSSISQTLNYSTARNIPPKLLFPVLALHYLETESPSFLHRRIFHERFELETFLVVALLVSSESYDPLEAQKLEFGSEGDLRVMQLKSNFIDVCFTLGLLNDACGWVISKAESCMSNYYDGILVHHVYLKMKDGAKWKEFFDGNAPMEREFCSLMEIILGSA